MNSSLEQLVQAAREGDKQALKILRENGYFDRLRAEKEGLPLVFSQRGIWALHYAGARMSGAYNITGAYRISGNLCPQYLQAAGQALVDRHESLRCRFSGEDQEPRQFISMSAEFTLSHHKLDPGLTSEQIRRKVTDAAAVGFDLQKAPLFRMHLFELEADQWILLLVMHHIIGDGWTVGLLIHELNLLYGALAKGQTPSLELSGSWTSYVRQQCQIVESDAFNSCRDFWKNTYSPVPEAVSLPADAARPAQPTYAGNCLAVNVPESANHAIGSLSKETKAGAFTVLDTAVKLLCWKYTGADDQVTLFPYSGRTTPEMESTTGLFMRTLPLRMQCREQMKIRECLETSRDHLFDVFENQPYSLDLLLSELGASAASAPLSRVMVVLQEQGQTDIALGDLDVGEYDCGFYPALFDLVFEYVDGNPAVLRIHYSANLFEEKRVNRIASHLFTLLENMAANPEQSCGQVSYLSADERNTVVQTFNGQAVVDFGDEAKQSFVDLVQAQWQNAPQNPAILLNGKTWTASQALSLIGRVANYLNDKFKLNADDRVGVVVDRTEWLPLLMLGIMRAGGCYVPIDPSYPPERVRYMLEDAGCIAVFADETGHAALPQDLQLATVDPQAVLDSPDSMPDSMPDIKVGLGQLAYMIYTSGSTGRPKGVQIEHRGMVNLALGLRKAFSPAAGDTVLQFASCSFDASVFDMVMAFGSGAALAMIPRKTLTEPDAFSKYIRDHNVTMATLTPAFVEAMEPQVFSGLRYMMTAGEAARPASARNFQKHLCFVNGYGPTETTICSNWHIVGPDDPVGELIPVGVPMYNDRIYIMDACGQPCGIGIPGEICIAGAGVGRGYHNRPELTAAAFTPDPFGENERMYRTGDIGYWLDSGKVVCIGRRDGQVKIRGFRIELGEVENALCRAAGVSEAVAVVIKDATGVMLAGCYVASELADEKILRRKLAEQIPDYMIPSVFVGLHEWPLTPAGKIDRSALVELARQTICCGNADREQEAQADEAMSEREELIASVWKQVLGIADVKKNDSFYTVGGDSIRAIRVVHALRAVGVAVTAAELLANPTIAALAHVVHPEQSSAAIEDASGSFIGTPVQQWFASQQQTEAGNNRFNQATSLRFKRAVEPEHVHHAIDALASHHASLRLRMTHAGSADTKERFQILSTEEGKPYFIHEQIDANHAQALEEIAERLHAMTNPVTGPVFCAAYITSNTDARLLLVAHHLCVDFVTWDILCDDLATALDACVSANQVRLPECSCGLRQWVNALENQAASVTEQLPYWKKQLAASPETLAGYSRRTSYSECVSYSVQLSPDEIAALRENGLSSNGLAWPDLLLALTFASAGTALQTNQLSMMLETAGRKAWWPTPVADRVAGWFTSMYPVCCDGCTQPASRVVSSARKMLQEVPAGGLSFDILRYFSDEGRRDLSPIELPQILFHYAGAADAEMENDWFALEENTPGRPIAPERKRAIAIELVFEETRDGSLRIDCSAPAERNELADAILQAFQSRVKELIEASGNRQTVSRLDYDGFENDAELDAFLKQLAPTY